MHLNVRPVFHGERVKDRFMGGGGGGNRSFLTSGAN